MEEQNTTSIISMIRCRSACAECKKHFIRIKDCMHLVQEKFPLSVETGKALTVIERALCDQFLYRFSKLQDAIGRHLIPALYTILEQDDSPKPFIDILNRLEKLGVITSVSDWQYFRNIRNNLAHEYPDREDESVQAVNQLYTDWMRFEALYLRLNEEAERLLQ